MNPSEVEDLQGLLTDEACVQYRTISTRFVQLDVEMNPSTPYTQILAEAHLGMGEQLPQFDMS